jgi:hypothetical protein
VKGRACGGVQQTRRMSANDSGVTAVACCGSGGGGGCGRGDDGSMRQHAAACGGVRRRQRKEEEEKRVVASCHDTVKYDNSPRAEKKKVDKLKITAPERSALRVWRAEQISPFRGAR